MNKQYFMKRLAVSHPMATDNYSYDMLPDTFLAHDKLPITCYQHGVFYQKACTHLLGSGCPSCGLVKTAMAGTLTTDEFIASSKARHGDRYDYSKTIYVKKDVALTITCPTHGDIVLTPDQHRWSKHGCKQCDVDIPKANRWQRVLNRAIVIHGDRYDYSRVNFANCSVKVEIVCHIHGSFWQSMYDHTAKGTQCPRCVIFNDRLTLTEFVCKSVAIHGNRYNYDKVNYQTNSDTVTITCYKHGDFSQRAGSHLAGNGCKRCGIEDMRLSTDSFIEKARHVHGAKYDYSRVSYHTGKTPVEIVCPVHGSFWQKPNSHVSAKSGCNGCIESKGERVVKVFLEKHGIEHVREYKIEPHLYRYDFYLPNVNVAIEFNGIQHYKPVARFGGMDGYRSVVERDAIKKAIAACNGVALIVLTHQHLDNNTVELTLAAQLKQLYACWYLVNGVVMVFKYELDAYNHFDIPLSTPMSELPSAIAAVVTEFSVLF